LRENFGRLKRNLRLETGFEGLKVILRRKNGFGRDFSAQFTFSAMAEFVSRRYAVFSAGSKIVGVLELHFTFSTYMEFVKWTKKSPAD